jgi:hypothetical protein
VLELPARYEPDRQANCPQRVAEAVYLSLKHTIKNGSWAWCHMSVVPATWETEVGGSLEPGQPSETLSPIENK